MSAYSAVVGQPIVEGVIRVDPNTLVASFTGRGVSSIAKNAVGDFNLLFDQGLQGAVALDATVTPSVPPGTPGGLPVFGRTMLTLRGSPTGAPVDSTTITEKSISYIFGADPTQGAIGVRVVLSIGGAGTDPTGEDADGCEIIIWRANTRADNFSQQIFGPLFGN